MKQTGRLLPIRRLESSVTPESPILAYKGHYDLPQKQFACDMHFAFELGVVLRGSMQRLCPQWKKTLGPGQMWLCGVWEPHGYKTVTAPCDVAVFLIWPAAVAEISYPEAPRFNWMAPFVVPAKNRPGIPDALRPSIIALGKRAAALANRPLLDEHTKLKLRLYLMEALLALTEEWRPPTDRKPRLIPFYARLNQVIEQVFNQRRFMAEHEAAHICRMSRYAFCNAFHQMMGITFGDFMFRYRLNGARNQLLSTTNSIKEIADNWGFFDQSHLHHAFTRHYGCPPSTYKNKNCNVD